MSTKVITLNVNGIRASEKKGLMKWLAKQNPDFVCFQELKAQDRDLSSNHLTLVTKDSTLRSIINCSKRPGYSGVSIMSKIPPSKIILGINNEEFDKEGRVIRADYDNYMETFPMFSLVSLYLPSGSSSDERQAAKFRFLEIFKETLNEWMRESKNTGRQFLLCGDWNIAHSEIDLKNWRANRKNSGFLPEERNWLSQIVFANGWVDVYRKLKPHDHQYTWWSQRGKARENNVGWRIDYQISTKEIAQTAVNPWVEMSQNFSDHAPLIIDYC